MKESIRAKATELGFAVTGFTHGRGDPQWACDLTEFLADGRQGQMDWLAERVNQRVSPQGLWPETCSVIMLGTLYAPPDGANLAPPDRATISVYARNKDYHDLIKKRLKALGRWMVDRYGGSLKVFVDTAPVMEKPLAAQAGLGWRGKHTNIVSRDFGGWLFLSAIYTTLDLPADAPSRSFCGRCDACIRACPTNALDSQGRMDARACLSYLSIEHKGPIPQQYRAAMGNRVYGCDACLAVCPWNKFAPPTREDDFFPRAELLAPRLVDFLALDDAAFRQIFSGSPLKRIGRDRFLRNVLIAIGNSQHPDLAAACLPLIDDPNPMVQEAASWAVARLRGEGQDQSFA